MEQQSAIMNYGTMVRATVRAMARVEAWTSLVERVSSDARQEERLAQQLCKACFYSPPIGGAAITNRPCMSCGENQSYGSTATDVLCMACAKEHALCKHCGGDLAMQVERPVWPTPVQRGAAS